MKNIIKKSLLIAALLIGVFLYASAYDHIGVAAGTIELGTISTTPGAGNKFGKYKDGAYLYRGTAWSYSSGKGIKTQNSNSGVVFYLANSADITITVLFDASKNFANVDAKLYTISDSDYDKLFTGVENKTAVTFSSTDYETKTVVIDKKGNFQETFSALPAGYYYIVCTGTGSNTYFTQLIVGESSTPVTPTVSSITVSPANATLDINGTQQLTATVDASPASADKTVTWSTSNANVATVSTTGMVTAIAQGTATITATSNLDNTKSGTCAITVNAPAAPIEVESISIKTATTIAIGGSETLSVTYTPSDANTGKAITWTSDKTNIATVDANGKVTGVAAGTAVITATSEKGKKATCTVTVQAVAVTGVSIAPTSVTIKEGATTNLTATVQPSNATNKNISWSSNKTNIATVNASGVVTGVAVGEATITVTTEDGNKTATCTVTVEEASPVPQTDLSLHLPEVYNAKESEGGYGADLTVVGGREYEVYYINRDGESKLDVATSNTDKSGCITNSTGDASMRATDGWFTVKAASSGGDTNASAQDEYGQSIRKVNIISGNDILLHVKGFDQFSFYGKDNSTGGTKNFEVYINDVKQTMAPDNTYSIRRFDIDPGEKVIRITAIGTSNNTFVAFSLRVAQEPRVKYLEGNDSAQNVWAGRTIRPITYYTKYNDKGETRLLWDGPEATGISLSLKGKGAIGDTLQLAGTAACPAGEYKYRVASFTSGGVMTASVKGQFTVKTQISFKNIKDTIMEVYQGENMDPILFTYFAKDADEITLDWGSNVPAGITGSGENESYSISGIPQSTGTYTYTLTVAGGNSVQGQLKILELNLDDDPVLFLLSDREAYTKDGIYAYLKDELGYNLVARVAQAGLRSADQYARYKWILISEDADAENGEVLAIIRDGAGLPVLNMQAFAYAPNRLDWGEPNNGSVTDEGRYITVTRGDHPIFQKLHKNKGDKMMVLNSITRVGMMPIDVQLNGSLCLATALKRDLDDYYADGDAATFLHEIPASSDLRDGTKYICMPISISSSKNLSTDGKKLVDAVVEYLLSDKPTVSTPTLEITSFRIGNLVGSIDQNANIITFDINTSEYPDLDLSAVTPTITLADPENTLVEPGPNEPVDMQWTQWIPVYYTVTDHVCQRVYTIVINLYSPEGVEEVYTAGEWVNIFDIYGRKVATTNEDIYSMSLPHGMYIVVTENGQTLKIMR